jgi:hypothetical protein
MAMYDVESSKTEKLKKAYVVGADGKTEKLKKAYVVNAEQKLEKLWSGFTPMFFSNYDNVLYASEDALNWNPIYTYNEGVTSSYIMGFLCVNEKYYMITRRTKTEVYSSEDCVNWTLLCNTLPWTDNYNFKYINGKFLLILGKSTLYYSDDCITWVQGTVGSYHGSYEATTLIEEICYGTVNGVTGYYVLKNLASNYGFILTRYATFDALISNIAPTVLFQEKNSYTDNYCTLILANNMAFVAHARYDGYTYLYVYKSGRTTLVSYNYRTLAFWSDGSNMIFALKGYKTYIKPYTSSVDGSLSSAYNNISTTMTLMIGKYGADKHIHAYDKKLWYSLDGCKTFTLKTFDMNIFRNTFTNSGLVLYYSGSEDGGFVHMK